MSSTLFDTPCFSTITSGHWKARLSSLPSDSVGESMLKGQCHEIFCFWFFHQSVSPQPQSIPFGPFRIFSKIREDIRRSRLTTGVVDTGGKWKKSSIRKLLIILLVTPLDSRGYTYIHFCLQVNFKVSAAWYYSHCLPPVSLTPVANLPPVSTPLAKLWKFATGVIDTGGAPWLVNISANFRKNLKWS